MKKGDTKHRVTQRIRTSAFEDTKTLAYVICSIKIGAKLCEEFPVNKGLRQGCTIAPTLF